MKVRGVVWSQHKLSNRLQIYLVTGLFFFLFVGVSLLTLLPMPESHHLHGGGDSTFPSHLPLNCQAMEREFHHVQTSTKKYPVNLCCHRGWCDSFGHCEPCMGLGDRTRHLLQRVQNAFNRQIPIRIDYPLVDVDMPPDVLYQDPTWLANLLHYRSYDVSSRETEYRDWGTKPVFAHFFAYDEKERYQNHLSYDPCLFHILFQPSRNMQRELDQFVAYVHNSEQGKHFSPWIGIHFRTGDAVAFADSVQETAFSKFDNRMVKPTIEENFAVMMTCARELKQQIYPDTHVNYVLATDHPRVKELAKDYKNVYSSYCQPSVFTSTSGERCTWIDLYLLLKTDAIVVNVRPQNYAGKAMRLSTLASLVKEVNSLDDQHVWECDLRGTSPV